MSFQIFQLVMDMVCEIDLAQHRPVWHLYRSQPAVRVEVVRARQHVYQVPNRHVQLLTVFGALDRIVVPLANLIDWHGWMDRVRC